MEPEGGGYLRTPGFFRHLTKRRSGWEGDKPTRKAAVESSLELAAVPTHPSWVPLPDSPSPGAAGFSAGAASPNRGPPDLLTLLWGLTDSLPPLPALFLGPPLPPPEERRQTAPVLGPGRPDPEHLTGLHPTQTNSLPQRGPPPRPASALGSLPPSFSPIASEPGSGSLRYVSP